MMSIPSVQVILRKSKSRLFMVAQDKEFSPKSLKGDFKISLL